MPLDSLQVIHHDYGKECYLPADKTQQEIWKYLRKKETVRYQLTINL